MKKLIILVLLVCVAVGIAVGIQGKTIGGTEAWADDLVVQFEPGSAKQGHLTIRMVCGKNPKRMK